MSGRTTTWSPGSLQLTVQESSTLGDWAPQWDALTEVLQLHSPYLRSWWVEGAATRPLAIFIVSSGRDLLGGLATQYEQSGRVRRFESVGGAQLFPIHWDLLAVPEHEAAVSAALASHFDHMSDIWFTFHGAAAEHRLSKALPHPPHQRVATHVPYTELVGTFDSYLASRTASHRHNVRRRRRRLAREGVTHARLEADEVQDGLDALERLHRLRFGADSVFLPAFGIFAGAAKTGAQRGEVEFHVLAHGDRTVAVQVTLVAGGRVCLHQTGIDLTDRRYSGAGTVLVSRVVEDAFDRDMEILDLGSGDEDYKAAWATEQLPLYQVTMASGPRAAVRAQVLDKYWRLRHHALKLRRLRRG